MMSNINSIEVQKISQAFNINDTREIQDLLEKADYVKSLVKSIKWQFASPLSISELITSPMKQEKANALMQRLFQDENEKNHSAYQIVPSRHYLNQWRIVVNLELIHKR